MPETLTQGWGLAVLLAAGLGSLTAFRPVWGLCAFAALFPFDVSVLREAPWTVYAGEALLAGLAGGFVLFRLRTAPGPGRTPAAGGALAVLAVIWAAAAVSGWGTADRWAAIKQALRWSELWGGLALTAWITRSRRDAAAVADVYVAVAGGLAILGIVEVLAGPASWLNAGSKLLDENQRVVRAHGPFSPNAFAPYLGLALLLLTAATDLWPRRAAWRSWLAAVPIGAALVLTQSRIGWVAAAAGLAVVAVRRWLGHGRRLLVAAAAALVLIAALSVVFPGVAGRLRSLRHPQADGNFSFRVRLFHWAGTQWAARPWTGYGAGSYPGLGGLAPQPLPPALLPAATAHAHNLFVQVALETGALGLVAWMLALSWLGRELWRSAGRAPALGAAGLGLLAAFLVNNMLEYTLVHSRGVLYALGWGAVLGASGRGSRDMLVAMPSLNALRRRLAGPTLVRDGLLFGTFVAIVAWSLFFSLPRSGGPAPAAPAAAYRGQLVLKVRDLAPAAWPEIHPGDVMAGVAQVTRVAEDGGAPPSLLVTLRVTGPVEFLNLRWPFPPKEGPLKIGSVVAFETERYRFMGEVVRKSP